MLCIFDELRTQCIILTLLGYYMVILSGIGTDIVHFPRSTCQYLAAYQCAAVD